MTLNQDRIKLFLSFRIYANSFRIFVSCMYVVCTVANTLIAVLAFIDTSIVTSIFFQFNF